MKISIELIYYLISNRTRRNDEKKEKNLEFLLIGSRNIIHLNVLHVLHVCILYALSNEICLDSVRELYRYCVSR